LPELSETQTAGLKTFQLDGLDIAYLDEGDGPAVLLCHCSSASHREWQPLAQMLAPDWHVLAPDFIGYGRSDSWPVQRPFSSDGDVEVLLALAKTLKAGRGSSKAKSKGRLHIVGHSYGAAVALEAAVRLGERVQSLSLVEPVSFHLLRQQHDPTWREVEKLGVKVLSAVARGDDRRAAGYFMSYWLGRLRWFLAPEKFKAAIAATIPKVALEFTVAIDAPTTLADYAKVEAPTLLLYGTRTRAPARAVAELLAQSMPNVQLVPLQGAGHMSPFTHPLQVNQRIAAHLATHR
jgi:pimeloyl-ACP methyl ester carboxylesterase